MVFPYNTALLVYMLVENIGRFNNEVGMAGSEGLNGTKVDNINPQELECVFFTMLCAFLEGWTGFTCQSQAEVDRE